MELYSIHYNIDCGPNKIEKKRQTVDVNGRVVWEQQGFICESNTITFVLILNKIYVILK